MAETLSSLPLLLEEIVLMLFLIGALLALLIGLLYLLFPDVAGKISRHLNHWVSMRRRMKCMESPHATERFLYRHHRLFGVFILLSSCYVLYQFGFHYDQQKMLAAIADLFPRTWIADWLLSAMLWFTLPATLFAILIGAIFSIRPSSLKRFEYLSNRWISSRKWLLPMETPRYPLDSWVARHPRLFGGLTALFSAYLSIVFLLLAVR